MAKKGAVTVKISKNLQRMLDGSAFTRMEEVNRAALRESAELAQHTTRKIFNAKTRQSSDSEDRPGRQSTHGQFAENLYWDFKISHGNSVVFFDWEEINAVASNYWLVQEVGTNKTFDIIGGRSSVFPSGALQGGKISSQRGRTIPFGLQWGVGGVYVPPGRKGDGALLTPLSQLTVPEKYQGKIGQIKIRNEIAGKHFVKEGGQVGFQFYRTRLVDEYRRVFQ